MDFRRFLMSRSTRRSGLRKPANLSIIFFLTGLSIWHQVHLVSTDIMSDTSNSYPSNNNKHRVDRQSPPLNSGNFLPSLALHRSSHDRNSGQSTCAGCSNESNRMRRMEGIKRDILEKLGLEKPPRIPANARGRNISHIRPLEPILDSEKMQNDFVVRSDDDSGFRPEKIISFGGPVPAELNFTGLDGATYFTISSKVRLNLLDKTNFWVYIRHSNPVKDYNRQVKIDLHTLHRTKPQPQLENPTRKVVERKTITITHAPGQWISFQLRKAIPLWLEDPSKNQGVLVEIHQEYKNLVSAITEANNNEPDAPFGPYLEVRLGNLKRHRRSLPFDCSESHPASTCCRYPLQVDFGTLGWDFIIAPRLYEAYYCSGECTAGFNPIYPHSKLLYEAVNHTTTNPPTHTNHDLNQIGRNPNPGPCCTPSKVADLMMLYFDNNGDIVYGTVPGMVVNRCACA